MVPWREAWLVAWRVVWREAWGLRLQKSGSNKRRAGITLFKG